MKKKRERERERKWQVGLMCVFLFLEERMEELLKLNVSRRKTKMKGIFKDPLWPLTKK